MDSQTKTETASRHRSQESGAYQLGYTYGRRYAHSDRSDRDIARLEAWVRCTDGVDESDFERGFNAGWARARQVITRSAATEDRAPRETQ